MIEESVRELTAKERGWLRDGMGPVPATSPPYGYDAVRTAAAMAAGFLILTLVAAFVEIGGVPAPVLAGLFVLAAIVSLARLAAAYREYAAARDWRRGYLEQNRAELTRALEDGHAVVKRVRAVAVVEIEPMEDEGTGYLYDLGDGRVLFLKGQGYEPEDEDTPWPNTEFEIVRTRAAGRWLDLRCHGEALRPVRLVRADECDPQAAWDEREVVLEMGLDDAVKTILARR